MTLPKAFVLCTEAKRFYERKKAETNKVVAIKALACWRTNWHGHASTF